MPKIKEMLETITPILFKHSSSSITFSLSKRFFVFKMLNRAINFIENEPYLNFISLLKNYKVLGKILTGTIKEFYRDRNSIYFKQFFPERSLYLLVKKDIEEIYKIKPDITVTITRRGLLIYDNYKKNHFNVLLLTIHGGTWVPNWLEKKMDASKQFRYSEEDIDTNKLYRNLVLKYGGIWIDNKQSRFACDYNRKPHRVIYHENSEKWLKRKMWKEELTKKEETKSWKVIENFISP